MDSLVLTNSLNLGPFFSKDLFCDAFFTKDNVALIPIHRNIMAGVSSRFRAMFEENSDHKVFVVPLVDYGTLKKIVKFIYSSSVSFEKQEELEDFRTALGILKLEVPGIVVGAPSVEKSKVCGTDENLNSKPIKEMEQEDLIEKEHEDLVKNKQQEDLVKVTQQGNLVKETQQEDLAKKKQQEDLVKKQQENLVKKKQQEDQEDGEVTSLSTDSEEKGNFTRRTRCASQSDSDRSSSPSPPRRSSPLGQLLTLKQPPLRKDHSAPRKSLYRKLSPRRPSHFRRTAPSRSPSPLRKLPIPRKPTHSRRSSPPSSQSSRSNRSSNRTRHSPSRRQHRKPPTRKSSPLRECSAGAERYEMLRRLCSYFARGCCLYGNSCKHAHTAGDFVESEVFQSRMSKDRYIAFFVDDSGTVGKESLEYALVTAARPGQSITVDKQERGFGHPGNMFKVSVAKPHTRRTAEMFNSETLLVKGVELKKPAWWNRNRGRKEEGEQPRFEQATSDLRDKIRSKQLEAEGVEASLNKGVKREPEEWQENHHSRKRIKVELKAEVKEDVDDETIPTLKQERDSKHT